MKKVKGVFLAGMCAIMLCCSAARPAIADMLILPMRVYFKDGDRMKGLTVVNTGEVQAIYRLAYEAKKQMPDGSYMNLNEPLTPGYDPSQWLVHSPRQVDLLPQAKQGIRISLRRPEDMPDGEYRTHIVLKRVARENIELRGEGAPQSVSPTMMINVGFAVPVIIRKGRYDTQANIESFKMLGAEAGGTGVQQQATIEVSRTGKYSAIGRLMAYWTPPGGGEEIMVSPRNSLVIFPEVSKRSAKVSFDRPIQGGKMRVVYEGMEADSGITFDEKTFVIQ